MTAQAARQMESPRFENEKSKILAGLHGHFTGATVNEIPALWQRFAPTIGHLPQQIDTVAYGVVEYRGSGGFDYMPSVEVPARTDCPLNSW